MSLKIGIVGVVLLVVLGGAVLLLGGEGNPGGARTGAVAQLPQLSFTDFKGNQVALADFAGKPLVVNSWAAWCPFCVKELPDFSALQKEMPGIVVIAIDRAESVQTAQGYTDDLGITEDMVFLLDPTDSFYKAIGGFSMPETLFVDKDGVVQDHKRGPMDLNEMKQRAQKIL